MAINRMILKNILPTSVPAAVIVGMLTYGSFCLVNNNNNNCYQTPNEKKQNKTMVLFLAVCLASIICSAVAKEYYKSKKFAQNAARKYLENATKDYPELKDFELMLNNNRVMQNIATVISNNLHKNEQKQIFDIISNVLHNQNLSKDIAIARAHKQIYDIINQHINTHPEFMQNVRTIMAHAKTTYIMSTQNYTR